MTSVSNGDFNPDIKVDLKYTPKELAEVKKRLASAENIALSSFNNYMNKSYIPMINRKFTILNNNINKKFNALDSKVNNEFKEINSSVSKSTEPIKEELKETKESFDYANQYINELKNQGREVNNQINKANDSVERKLAIFFTLRLLPVAIVMIAVACFAGIVSKITNMILAMNNGVAEFAVSVTLIFALVFACCVIWRIIDSKFR